MEKLTKNIAKKISTELDLNKDQREVLAYGTFAAMQTLLSIVLVITIGAFFDVVIEALIISFTIGILRKYSGGIHASSPGICNLLGTFVTVAQAVFILKVEAEIAPNVVIFLGIVIFLWAFFLVFKLAPVDSPTKPIRKEEKKRRLRNASILTLCVFLVIVFICISLTILAGINNLLTYAICIYGGVVWQVFTLTQVGHVIITKVDIFLNKIFR